MDERNKALKEFKHRPIQQVLEEYASLKQREWDGEELRIPRVTVHLRSGRDLTGSVLDVLSDTHRGERSALMQLDGRPDDVVSVPLGVIEALTVHDVPTLSKPPPGARSPSRLEMKREAAGVATRVSEVIGAAVACEVRWETVPETEEAMRTLADVVKRAEDVLRALATDDMGMRALREKVRTIRFEIADDNEVKLELQVLVVRTVLAWPKRLASPRMTEEIEKSL